MSVGFFSSLGHIIGSCITFIFKAIWFIITAAWHILVFLCKLPFKIIGWCWEAVKFLFSLVGSVWDGCWWLISHAWDLASAFCAFVWGFVLTLTGWLWQAMLWGWNLCLQLGTWMLHHPWQTVVIIMLLLGTLVVMCFSAKKEDEEKKAARRQKKFGWQKAIRLKELDQRIPIEDEWKLAQIIAPLPQDSKKRKFLVLYKNILDELGALIEDLKKEIINIQQESPYQQARAGVEQLSAWHRGLAENVHKLAVCADWDTFTFAFYGETNAGKSTLIESLRLLLKESTKLQEQAHCAACIKNDPSGQSWAQYQDGAIIGDGRSDYTQETTSYLFSVGETNFRLLDLPGIEGKEDLVIENISNSLRQAHAVFYISSKNTPPQKGDDGKEGTLEKIKNYLNDQAEVYFIWNKRITNATALALPLEDESSAPALLETEQCLKKYLGQHYRGHITLSAQPAFLGLAKYLERSITKNKQEKFIKQFSPDELVFRSNLQVFVDSLVNQADPAKIEESNIHKLYCILQEAARVAREYNKATKNMHQVAVDEVKKAQQEIKTETDNFVTFIRRQTGGLTEAIMQATRRSCYARIERGISSDGLKDLFENRLKNATTSQWSLAQAKIHTQQQEYAKRIQAVITRLQNHLSLHFAQIDKKLGITVSAGSVDVVSSWNSRNVIGLAVAAGGAYKSIALLAAKGFAWNPAMLAIGSLVALGWILWNVLKKKARQKEAIEKALVQVEAPLRKNINKEINKQVNTLTQQEALMQKSLDEIPVPFEAQQERLEKFINFLRLQADRLRRRNYANK